MKIVAKENKDEVTLICTGSINSKTSSELEKALADNFEKFTSFILDFSGVDYLSSSGLRVLLMYQNESESSNKKIKIINSSDEVKEVFEITGFSSFLDIE